MANFESEKPTEKLDTSSNDAGEALLSDTRETQRLGDPSAVDIAAMCRDNLAERVNSPEYRESLRAMSVEQLQNALRDNEAAIANYRAFTAQGNNRMNDARNKC